MAWGCNKFLKKLIKPNAISNNELADFISRVPDNEELVSMVDFFSSIHTQMKQMVKIWIFSDLHLSFSLQKDIQELPSPEDVAKAKLQIKKKPASDAEII